MRLSQGVPWRPYITRLNTIRKNHLALGDLQNLTLHSSTDDATIVYSKHKTLPDGTKDTLIIVVNVDPHSTRESTVSLNLEALQLAPLGLQRGRPVPGGRLDQRRELGMGRAQLRPPGCPR